jgi:hypothetical protein
MLLQILYGMKYRQTKTRSGWLPEHQPQEEVKPINGVYVQSAPTLEQ